MSIGSLEMISFRNHAHSILEFNRGLTVIWGENGSGKTTVLEAIHSLSLGKSFRTSKRRELIKDGSAQLVLSGLFCSNGNDEKVSLLLNQNGERKIKINKDTIYNRKDLIGRNNTVVLSPEEQIVTSGPPSARRRFFDKMFSVVSRDYVNTLYLYGRLLKQRNAALKKFNNEQKNPNEIELWDDSLSDCGSQLWRLRNELLCEYQKRLELISEKYDREIKLSLLFNNNVPTKEIYRKGLTSALKKDLIRKHTSFGPHRDEISVYWNSRDLRSHGSQGEHKLALVILKLAELLIVIEKTNTAPIFLIDDLFAKLDRGRSRKIISLLQAMKDDDGNSIQTIVTTTDLLLLKDSGLRLEDENARTYHLERGCSI